MYIRAGCYQEVIFLLCTSNREFNIKQDYELNEMHHYGSHDGSEPVSYKKQALFQFSI
jgi:hypothetical protein